MKIALIGAQGVGKTTLAKQLASNFPSSVIVRETVRECPYPCDTQADFKTEWWVLSHSILAEHEARELKKDLIITDRCLLDISIYTKLIHEAADGRITDRQRTMIEQSIETWLQEDPYDALVLVSVDSEIWSKRDINDGFRSVDPTWYQILSNEFEAALQRFQLPKQTKVIRLTNNGSLQETYNELLRSCGLSQSTSARLVEV